MSELSKTVGHPAGVPEGLGMWKSGVRGEAVFLRSIESRKDTQEYGFFLYKKGFSPFCCFLAE